MWDETLYNRAFRVPKSIEELIFDAEQRELLNKAIAALPEIQRRRNSVTTYKQCHVTDLPFSVLSRLTIGRRSLQRLCTDSSIYLECGHFIRYNDCKPIDRRRL